MDQTTIESLPNELLTFIFEHLKVKDLIQCSLACKRFKLICKGVKIPELIICNKIENVKDLWFITNKQYNHQDAIDVATFCSNRSTLRLDKLKRLHFKGSKTEYDQLNVNDLTQLEQMKIYIKPVPRCAHRNFPLFINLANLRIIEIHGKARPDTFHIIAPKLEMLRCFSLEIVRLTYPHAIKHLEVKNHSPEYSKMLANVEFYQVYFEYIDWILRSDILSLFPKLRTLVLFMGYKRYFEPMRCLRDLVKQKFNLQRHELKIYFHCVELDSEKKIVEFYDNPSSLAFQINNFNSLRENTVGCYGGNGINYNELMHLVEGEIPVDFSKKYFNTRSVWVTQKVENPEHLLRFLNGFDYLSQLYLDIDSIDQSFYDGLSQLDQLTNLTIETGSKSLSNYDFLLDLKLLKWFATDSDSPKFLDLTLALFSRLKYFRSIKFYTKEFIKIRRFGPNDYWLHCACDDHLKLRLDFDGLVQAVGAFDKLINLDTNQTIQAIPFSCSIDGMECT